MIKCKITVLKRGFNKEFVEEYVEQERKKNLGPCEVFKEGQEFIVDPWSGLPSGFCPWAWDDIYKNLVGFGADGNFGMWYEDKNTIIACCTDGTRPVYFKIEKIKE
ncbi:MAG: TIGR04076 family protein [Brevinematales bacterium]|nr:TIGR04076 family protein [Brevinematales bacterium]